MNSDLVQHRSSADHALPSLSVPAAVAQHTPTPWYFNGRYICAADGLNINNVSRGPDEDRANAARIVACVNYCDGMPTTDLRDTRLLTLLDTAAKFQRDHAALRASNAELARYARHNEFCTKVADGIDDDCPCGLYAALARSTP